MAGRLAWIGAHPTIAREEYFGIFLCEICAYLRQLCANSLRTGFGLRQLNQAPLYRGGLNWRKAGPSGFILRQFRANSALIIFETVHDGRNESTTDIPILSFLCSASK